MVPGSSCCMFWCSIIRDSSEILYILCTLNFTLSCLLYVFRYPTFFDDIAARLLPVIPLIIYRLIENDAIDAADRVLQVYSTFLHYYPLNFTFVRDILAYFYGHLPGKLILRILSVLDVKKVCFMVTLDLFLFFISSNSALFSASDTIF